jgi:hypothetical protein
LNVGTSLDRTKQKLRIFEFFFARGPELSLGGFEWRFLGGSCGLVNVCCCSDRSRKMDTARCRLRAKRRRGVHLDPQSKR